MTPGSLDLANNVVTSGLEDIGAPFHTVPFSSPRLKTSDLPSLFSST